MSGHCRSFLGCPGKNCSKRAVWHCMLARRGKVLAGTLAAVGTGTLHCLDATRGTKYPDKRGVLAWAESRGEGFFLGGGRRNGGSGP